MTMKVLIANKFFFRNGGSEAVMFQEREFLLANGFDVVDFSMFDERNLPSDQADYFVGKQSYAGGSGKLGKISAALKLVHSPEAVHNIGRLIDDTRPDIVHCHNIYHQLTPSIIRAAKRRNVPVVLTLHDYKPVCPSYTRLADGKVCSACLDGHFVNVLRHRCADGSLGKSALLFAEAVVQRLLRSYEQVDKFIAPSRFMRDSVTGYRFPAGQVDVIYNGIDCRTVEASGKDDGYALYLGRLSAEKGVETLLAAQAEIADTVPLVIAGTGPLEQDLRSRYPKAHFLGYVSGEALSETIRNAAVIVIPSEWYENCPMSVLEAMAYGKPVIASDIGGIPELVRHGETGLLYPAGDAGTLKSHLLTMMKDPDVRKTYGANARRTAETSFSLDQHNAELLRLYQNVIACAGTESGRQASAPLAPPQE